MPRRTSRIKRRARRTRRGGARLPVFEKLAEGKSIDPIEMDDARKANAVEVVKEIARVAERHGITDNARIERILRDYADILEGGQTKTPAGYGAELDKKIREGKL
jgi:hypothetical protein